jgi:hypothetical protein
VPEARISKRFKAAWNDALHRGLNTKLIQEGTAC